MWNRLKCPLVGAFNWFSGQSRDCLIGVDPDTFPTRCNWNQPFHEQIYGSVVDLGIGLGCLGAGAGILILSDGTFTAIFGTISGGIFCGLDLPLGDLLTQVQAVSGGRNFNIRSEASLDTFASATIEAKIQLVYETGVALPTLVNEKCERTIYTGGDLAMGIFLGISRAFQLDKFEGGL
ncbi:hypothetical protein HC928_06570 [bacterium]|nr:hypothetical protein [bacterium]